MSNAVKNLRAVAAICITEVVEQGASLSQVLPMYQSQLKEKDRALLQEICFGVLRVLPQLEWFIQKLMKKVLTGKQRQLHYLLMVGLYQLIYLRTPDHAALSETVEGAKALKKTTFKNLINAILREFLRNKEALLEQYAQQDNTALHPIWLVEKLKQAYPRQWQQILDANNQKPPMWLRVNRQKMPRNDYLTLLTDQGIVAYADPELPDAIRLEHPVSVSILPLFRDGAVSIQDRSAQDAALWLAPQNGEHILDLCAAPGGKTCHILEIAPQAHVTAVDSEVERIQRIHENLTRLNIHADVRQGDGRYPQQWCENQRFQRMLIDAPCSGTGVIRRHPDIKWLRRPQDITTLAQLQHEILNAMWPYLETNGTLVYTTCSILPEENALQIEQFLQQHPDAQLTEPVKQCLPTAEQGDGFFYAKITKLTK